MYWHQKAGREEDGLVVWDYHVILIVTDINGTMVYDLDTNLPFPVTFQEYFTQTFGDETTILKKARCHFNKNVIK